MKVAILGTGMVGRTIGSKLVELGHEVTMGSRQRGNETARAWAAEQGGRGGEGSFADAAGFGDIVFNCTAGYASLDALSSAGKANLTDKIVIDVANPIDVSHGPPVTLAVCNTDSLGERIQHTFPETRVVKALNTVNCKVMVEPSIVPGNHVVFVCGNDDEAKAEVTGLLSDFGWPPDRVVDLGDISAARATEMYLILWIRLVGRLQSPMLNITVEH